jgi:hypothetical protein
MKIKTNIERAAYVNICAVMTGEAYREITMPFRFPCEFKRHFSEGPPEGYVERLGRTLRELHESTGLNIEVDQIATIHQGKQEKCLVVTFDL